MGRDLIAEHIASASNGQKALDAIMIESLLDGISDDTKAVLAVASCTKRAGWFKSVTKYQEIARDVIGPNLATAEPGFTQLVNRLFTWTHAP
jgi:hypothetical protein